MEAIRAKCIEYFGNDEWMFVRHPALGYICPWRWIKEGGGIARVEAALAKDTR
jgi:hypothetical protein